MFSVEYLFYGMCEGVLHVWHLQKVSWIISAGPEATSRIPLGCSLLCFYVVLFYCVNSGYDVEPAAAEEGLPLCEGVLPLVIHAQAWSSLREEGLRFKS